LHIKSLEERASGVRNGHKTDDVNSMTNRLAEISDYSRLSQKNSMCLAVVLHGLPSMFMEPSNLSAVSYPSSIEWTRRRRTYKHRFLGSSIHTPVHGSSLLCSIQILRASVLERTSIVHIEQGSLYRSAPGVYIALEVAESGAAVLFSIAILVNRRHLKTRFIALRLCRCVDCGVQCNVIRCGVVYGRRNRIVISEHPHGVFDADIHIDIGLPPFSRSSGMSAREAPAATCLLSPPVLWLCQISKILNMTPSLNARHLSREPVSDWTRISNWISRLYPVDLDRGSSNRYGEQISLCPLYVQP
ncbi:hypothetical protein KCU67_g121, partial [Aureobasidium melanogenum]